MRVIRYSPIGIVHSPLKSASGAPLQPLSARNIEGTLEIYPAYASGLKDLNGFSHLILVYHLHLSREASLTVRPFLDKRSHGIFATRAPVRPNPIGISVVRLSKVKGRMISVRDLDIVDGTPLLDIKPYVPEFDARKTRRIGWYKGKIGRITGTRSDSRFTSEDSCRQHARSRD
jgi:tRNA-Thr(GGU) m(6)t(6)A37 methyltransferase TsaA